MATIGHCYPSYGKYGGYYCSIVGIPTFFASTLKKAKEYFQSKGVQMVRL